MTAHKMGFAALALISLLTIAAPALAQTPGALTGSASTSTPSLYAKGTLGQSTCIVNGKTIPCDQVAQQMGGFLGATLLVFAVWIAVALIFSAFWLWMLIHAATHPIQNRALWILVIVFFNIVGAIVYYFAVKRGFDGLAKLAPQSSPAMASAGSDMASPLAPPVSPQISDYIRTSRQHGIADDAIRKALVGSGWNAIDVDRALHP